MTHRAEYSPASECIGQVWREAIAVLAQRSAELRLQASQLDMSHVATRGYPEHLDAWRDLMARADHLDELGHWLRENTEPPRTDR